MSGYQFGHMQSFSMKGNKVNRSARAVLAENSREPDQANHVPNPQPPILRYGQDPMALLPIIEKRLAEAKTALKGTGKRIQSNTHVLEGMVFSHPLTMAELRNDKELQQAYVAWRKDMIRYAVEDAKSRGMETLSIVEHHDEAHPHIHVLSIPKLEGNPRLDAKQCHPGHRAARAAQDAGKQPREQMAEYRKAMKDWQDNLWENVSIRHGLTRTGPRRRRMTRTEWTATKADASLLQQTIEYHNELKNSVGSIEGLQKENAHLHATVLNLESTVDALKRDLSALRHKSEADIADIRQRANQIIGDRDKTIESLNQELDSYRPRRGLSR